MNVSCGLIQNEVHLGGVIILLKAAAPFGMAAWGYLPGCVWCLCMAVGTVSGVPPGKG